MHVEVILLQKFLSDRLLTHSVILEAFITDDNTEREYKVVSLFGV